ncbi:hypothetical protein K435DRAFT_803557 [Dendrothele bispora CBS 962.96]|uniref:Uncharacterized protein n=1 Tax=Dendrothele bispora (strain CBS 962.96) TaxID=1314807 RepID=A0A4S8LHG7_DENBC|nr:hypothetical protein K435DRAFT_803557 [Dendrothele bispora CBS 962.96]
MFGSYMELFQMVLIVVTNLQTKSRLDLLGSLVVLGAGTTALPETTGGIRRESHFVCSHKKYREGVLYAEEVEAKEFVTLEDISEPFITPVKNKRGYSDWSKCLRAEEFVILVSEPFMTPVKNKRGYSDWSKCLRAEEFVTLVSEPFMTPVKNKRGYSDWSKCLRVEEFVTLVSEPFMTPVKSKRGYSDWSKCLRAEDRSEDVHGSCVGYGGYEENSSQRGLTVNRTLHTIPYTAKGTESVTLQK